MQFSGRYYAIWIPVWLLCFGTGYGIVSLLVGPATSTQAMADNNSDPSTIPLDVRENLHGHWKDSQDRFEIWFSVDGSVVMQNPYIPVDDERFREKKYYSFERWDPTSNKLTLTVANKPIPDADVEKWELRFTSTDLGSFFFESNTEQTYDRIDAAQEPYALPAVTRKQTGSNADQSDTNQQTDVKIPPRVAYSPLLKKTLEQVNSAGKMTDSQAEFLVNSVPARLGLKALSLPGITSLSNRQAEILSKVDLLVLDGLTIVTPEQALSLGKLSIGVQLNGLQRITDSQVKGLCNLPLLSLNGLTYLTPEQADKLSNCVLLELNGLTAVTDQQAENLGRCLALSLDGLTTITDQQAIRLVNNLEPLDRLPEILKTLARVLDEDFYSVRDLNGLTSITAKQIEILSKADGIGLNGLTSITDDQVTALAKFDHVSLDGLTFLSTAHAKKLSGLTSLSLQGLKQISGDGSELQALSKVKTKFSPTIQGFADRVKKSNTPQTKPQPSSDTNEVL